MNQELTFSIWSFFSIDYSTSEQRPQNFFYKIVEVALKMELLDLSWTKLVEEGETRRKSMFYGPAEMIKDIYY